MKPMRSVTAAQRGDRGNRLQPMARRITDILIEHRRIGEEDCIEFRRFGALGNLLIKPDISNPVRLDAG